MNAAAGLAAIDRARARFGAPFFALTVVASTTTRSSCSPATPSASTASRITGHNPACVHSSSRRQQVLPCANPCPDGTRCHGCPDRATYRIPSKQARSDTRGRPRPRRLGTAGNTAATRAHNASLTTHDTPVNSARRFLDIHRDTTPTPRTLYPPNKNIGTGSRHVEDIDVGQTRPG